MAVSQPSHKSQLVATALVSAALTASLIAAYHALRRASRREALRDEIERTLADTPTFSPPEPPSNYSVTSAGTPAFARPAAMVYDEKLIREQLARNYAFFGEEGMARIRESSVVVVGCGGVGSWAAVMLARSGVKRIRLVDFDYTTLSSLNRHATATLADVGTPKVRSIERAIHTFTRWVEVDPRVEIWRKEEGGKLLEGMDWVVDAIDNISTKVDLLKYCHDHNYKVFSSMGAGAKTDPTRVQIADLQNTIYDPLARSVRQRLRRQGIGSPPSSSPSPSPIGKAKPDDASLITGIPVVYSTEVPGDVKLLPLPEEEFTKGPVKELGVYDGFRVRILPVLGPLPAIFGLNIATYILCELAGKPIPNPLPVKNRRKLYEKLLNDLKRREEKRSKEVINRLPIDEEDASLIFEDVHRTRSVVPPHPVCARPALVRWDVRRPITVENVVVMEMGEAEKHERESWVAVEGDAGSEERTGRDPIEVWGAGVADVVEARMKEVQRWRDWNGP